MEPPTVVARCVQPDPGFALGLRGYRFPQPQVLEEDNRMYIGSGILLLIVIILLLILIF
jgi:hypothetical protein